MTLCRWRRLPQPAQAPLSMPRSRRLLVANLLAQLAFGLLPALAGSAAAVAGLMQQLIGAAGGYAVGLFDHHGALNLGWLMFGLASCGALAQWVLHRRRA